MTTWELASAAEVEEIRRLVRRLERAGGTAPDGSDDLEGLTKKQAGVLRTALREALAELEII